MGKSVRVIVPGSSANLGPGYDVLAAAVSLNLVLDVEEADKFLVDPGDESLPASKSNLCVAAFEELHEADRYSFRVDSEIPVGAGLGSSAAAIVAGLIAANHLSDTDLSYEKLLELAVEIEGHPDNVGASLKGGIVICSVDGERPRVDRIDPPDWVRAVMVVPDERLSTEAAREVIPKEIPMRQSSANTASTALLVIGLGSKNEDLLARGLEDRVHQPRRRDLYPRSMELVERAKELGAIGATISGAGPSVLFWVRSGDEEGVATRLKDEVDGWAEVRTLDFVVDGARLEAGDS